MGSADKRDKKQVISGGSRIPKLAAAMAMEKAKVYVNVGEKTTPSNVSGKELKNSKIITSPFAPKETKSHLTS